jgi:hypothetical protein
MAEPCGCEEAMALRAEVAGLEKVNAELRAKLRAKGSEVPCHRCGLSKMEADKLGVADMTGPQLRLRVLQLEGELADYKAHAWVEMGDYIVVLRQRDALRELAKAWEAGRDAAAAECGDSNAAPLARIRALQPPGGKAKTCGVDLLWMRPGNRPGGFVPCNRPAGHEGEHQALTNEMLGGKAK